MQRTHHQFCKRLIKSFHNVPSDGVKASSIYPIFIFNLKTSPQPIHAPFSTLRRMCARCWNVLSKRYQLNVLVFRLLRDMRRKKVNYARKLDEIVYTKAFAFQSKHFLLSCGLLHSARIHRLLRNSFLSSFSLNSVCFIHPHPLHALCDIMTNAT